MTQSHQLQDDLEFVRNAVNRRESSPRTPTAIYYVVAIYVLVGYAMIDVMPRYCGLFFLVGGILVGIAGAVLGRRASKRAGEQDSVASRNAALHWLGGIALALLSTV